MPYFESYRRIMPYFESYLECFRRRGRSTENILRVSHSTGNLIYQNIFYLNGVTVTNY
jgi:hypothetical protein